MLRKSIIILAICIAILAVFGGTATASNGNGAFVVNHGDGLGGACTATTDSGVYLGYITHFVVTPSGVLDLGCQLWGPSVAHTMNFNGLRIDPSGHAVLSENGVS